MKRYLATHPEKVEQYRVRNLVRGKGLTVQEYTKAMELQKGCCAVCRENGGRRLSIDHDHRTGKFRGLLCTQCNSALGLFREDTNRLQEAIRYLEHFR